MDNETLLAQLRAHDEAGLDALIDQYGALIRQVIWRYLRGGYERGYTQDIENRCYYKIWAKIDTYDPTKGNFEAWVGTIAKHQALDYKKGLKGTFQDLDLAADYLAAEDPEPEIDWQPYLQQLSGQQLTVFKLFFVDGLYPMEIAQQLKMKPTAVYKNLSRARQKIQKGGQQAWQS